MVDEVKQQGSTTPEFNDPFAYLRVVPEFAERSNLDLYRLMAPTHSLASDNKAPLSDQALVRRIMQEQGIPEDQYDAFSKHMGLQKSGVFDEVAAGFNDGIAGMENSATNAFPAWMGRVAQQNLSPEVNDMLGTKEMVDSNLEDYQKQAQLNSETSETQAPTSLEEAKTYGDYLRFMGYSTGNAVASMAEVAGETVAGAAIGAGIGLATAGPAGAAAGAVAGGAEGFAARQGVKALVKNQIKNTLTKEALASTAVKKGAKYGALAGANTEMFKIQTGDYDQELLSREIDNPNLAGGMGVVGTMLEFAPELAAFGRINKVFNTPAGKEAFTHALISKAAGKDFLKTLGKETLINAPAEGVTEAAQQGLIELADKYINDADLMTPEAASRVLNSFAQGFLGSAGLTTGATVGQTLGKHAVKGVVKSPEEKITEALGTAAPEAVEAARASDVQIDDDEVTPEDQNTPQPAPVKTPEQVAVSTPTITTPAQAQEAQAAQDAVKANFEKAQTVAETAAAVEQKQAVKRRSRKQQQPSAVQPTAYVFPKELGSPKPTVNGASPIWNNDLEKALYIVGNSKTKSASHDKYVNQIKQWKPEWSDADVSNYGKQMIQAAKDSAKSKSPVVSDFLNTPVQKEEVPYYNKQEGKFVQLGDAHDTSAVLRAKRHNRPASIAVQDRSGGRADFTLSPDKQRATSVTFSPVDIKTETDNPELAKTLGGRPFFENTVKSLGEMGVKQVDLRGVLGRVDPQVVKNLVDAKVLTPTQEEGVFGLAGPLEDTSEFIIQSSVVEAIMAKFNKDGKEHGAAIIGRDIIHFDAKDNSQKSMFIPDDVFFRLKSSKEDLHFIHNHPRASCLSLQDLYAFSGMVGEKSRAIVSAIFGDSRSSAKMNVDFVAQMVKTGKSTHRLFAALGEDFRVRVNGAIRSGDISNKNAETFNSTYRAFIGFDPLFVVLDDAGILEYSSNLGFLERMVKDHPVLFDSLLKEAHKAVIGFLRAANFEGVKYEPKSKIGIDYKKSVQKSNGNTNGPSPYRRLQSGFLPTEMGPRYIQDKGIKTQQISQDSSLPFSGPEVVDTVKTPIQSEEKYRDVMKKVSDAIRQVAGDKVAVEFWDTMTAKTADGRMRDLRGYKMRNTIAVALGINEKLNLDPLETGFHEAFHSVYGMLPQSDKAILEADRSALQKYVRRNMRSLYGADLPTVDLDYFDAEEIGALAFGLYSKRKVDGVETNQHGGFKILNKIFNLIKQIGRVLSGRGYRTADDVFRDVFNGDYAEDGRLTPDTAIKLQGVLASEAATKAQKFAEARYFPKDILDITRDQSLAEYQKQAEDAISRGIPPSIAKDYGNLAYFFDSLKSMVGIGRTNPLISAVYTMLRKAHEETRAVMSHFALSSNDLLARGPALDVAAEHMDYASTNGIAPTITYDMNTLEPTVQYKRPDGKRVTLRGPSAKAYADLNQSFKEVLVMREAQLLVGLPDDIVNDPDDIQLTDYTNGYKNAYERYKEHIRQKDPKEVTKAEEDRLRVWGKMRNLIESKQAYFPQRRFGDFGIKVEQVDKDGNLELVDFRQIEVDPLSFTKQVDQKQEGLVRKELEKLYGGNKEFVISNTFKLTNNDVAKLFDHSKLSTEDVVSSFLDDYLTRRISEDLGAPMDDTKNSVAEVRKELLNDSDFLRKFERNIDKLFGERQNIEGYSKDYRRVVDHYFKTMPRHIIASKHRRIVNKHRVAVAHSQANQKVKDQANNLIDYVSDPKTDYGLVRQINFASTLGLNPAAAVLQLTSLGTILPGTLMQWQGSPAAALVTIGKASADAKAILSKANEAGFGGLLVGKTSGGQRLTDARWLKKTFGNKFSDSEYALIARMAADGDIIPVMAQEDVLGEIPTSSFANRRMYAASQLGNSVMKVLAGPMATVEQFSRLTAALAAHRSMNGIDYAVIENVLKDDQNFNEAVKYNILSGMEEADAVKFAAIQNSVDNVHAVYGKFARNWNQRGFFGAVPFAFMNFPIQAMEYLATMVKRSKDTPEARKALAYMIASMFMMGGLAGMPAWELFKSLYEKVYYLAKHEKIDLDYEIQDALKNTVGMPSPLVHMTMQGGVSALTQTNVGSRLSPSFFWQGLLSGALRGEVSVTDAMGVQGGMVNNMIKHSNEWWAGRESFPEAAMLALAPVFVRNAYTGLVGWPNDGVRNGRGNVILTPEDISVADSIKKSLGAQPRNVGAASQAEYVQYLKVNGANDYLSAQKDQLARIKMEIFNSAKVGNTKRTEKLRTEFNAKYQELLEFMRKQGDGQLSARKIEGLKSSIDQKYQKMKNPRLEASKQEQRVADEVRKNLEINYEDEDSSEE